MTSQKVDKELFKKLRKFYKVQPTVDDWICYQDCEAGIDLLL